MPISNVHDKAFKGFYLFRQVALEHVETLLDKEIVEELKLSTFYLETTSFVDEELAEHYSDIIYSCEMNSGKSAKVMFLFEHKSYLPNHPHVQIGRYIFQILTHYSKQGEDLPVVLPIVVYHDKNKKKWEYKSITEYYEGLPEHLQQYLPDFKIILTDITQYSDDFLLKLLEDKYLLNVFFALKYSRDKAFVIEKFKQITINLVENIDDGISRNLLTLISVYLSASSKIPQQTIYQLIHNLSLKTEEMAEKLLERLNSKSPIELLDIEVDLLAKRELLRREKLARKRAEWAQEQAEQAQKEERKARKKAELISKREEQARKKAELISKREEQARKKAELISKREEQARRKAELISKREEQARKKAELIAKEKEDNIRKAVLTLSNEYQHAPSVISGITGVSIEEIEQILKENRV